MKENHIFSSVAMGLAVAVVIWFGSNAILTSAAEGDEEVPAQEQDFLCAQNLIDKGSIIVEGYENFLNFYFQAPEPSSEQVEKAVAYFQQARRALDVLFEEGLDLEGIKSFDLANKEVQSCTLYRDQYVSYIEQLLEIHVFASTNSKVTFTVIDGLKIMNEDLVEFSDDFHGTFPKLFSKFNNALPCYAKQCI